MTTAMKESVALLVSRQRPYTLLECQLIEAIKSSLKSELFANAAFLSERLLAEVSNEEVKLLLAESYLGTHFLLIVTTIHIL